MKANWFQSKVKVNYLEFGTGSVNKIEDNAFDAAALRSVKHLAITKLNFYELKRGLFNGLESLEILNLQQAALIQFVDMGILDGVNQTLKELTIDGDLYTTRALPLEAFTGSNQTLNLEFLRVRYYLGRLASKTFISLTKIKYLDVSRCGIEYIEQGTFDPVIDSVIVLRLVDNRFTNLPAGMLDLVALNYDTYIFMGKEDDCECSNLPINYIVKVSCNLGNSEFDRVCTSYLPTQLGTSTSITENTPTTVTISSNENSSIQSTQTESTTSVTTSSKTSSISPHLQVRVKEIKSGDVIVYLSEFKENSTLIWYLPDELASKVHSRGINCPINQLSSNCSITVKSLKENSKYSFCVIDGEANEPSLCIQYTTKERYYLKAKGQSYLQVWLEKTGLNMIVLMTVVMIFLLMMICFIALLSR